MKQTILFLLALATSYGTLYAQSNLFETYYEKSNYLETPRYDQSIAYAQKLAEASEYITYTTFGTSPQGRDLPLLIIDKNRNFTPESVKNSGNAVLFVNACIHPGESEGKDAGFMLIRDIIIHNKYPELLNHTTLLFVPIFNVDGHERFSAYNRINQNGPKEMGWRTTATNLNLNRDFVKADAIEMQQWLTLFNQWLPDMFMDIHTTDGADYQYQLTYYLHNLGDMNPQHTQWQTNYLTAIEKQLLEDDVLIFPYVSFRRWHDPRSGLISHNASPRFSTGYASSHNRPALLVETHMLKDYKTRVDATYHLLRHTLGFLDDDYKNLININQQADLEASGLSNSEFILSYETSKEDSIMVNFKGVEYDIVPSDLTDGIWVQFSDKPKDYEIVMFNHLIADVIVNMPRAYIIPVEWKEVIQKLKLHGIQYDTLKEAKEFEIETYQFNQVQFANYPYEGRQMVQNFETETIKLKKEFRAGSAVVPTNQRTARIIAHLLEPKAPDSFVRWGFFNTIFERKEYVETYVMEKMAREMIEENPELLNQYKQALEDNPQLYNNQWAKLFWFYALTPYWDQQKDVYPVGKLYNP